MGCGAAALAQEAEAVNVEPPQEPPKERPQEPPRPGWLHKSGPEQLQAVSSLVHPKSAKNGGRRNRIFCVGMLHKCCVSNISP